MGCETAAQPSSRNPAYTYFDAHTHLDEETEAFFSMLEARGMAVAASLSWPFRFPRLTTSHHESDRVFFTVGIHPWDADRAALPELKRAFAEIAREGVFPPVGAGGSGRRRIPHRICAVGEIGMDNVWCDIPLDIQRRVFLSQLDWAVEIGLPVVLHTKGCEEEIAALIAPYPGPFLVHWYSCPNIFPAYLGKGCFFSVGPDASTNDAVQNVIRAVPMDRLMVETDGRGAVEWATGAHVAEAQIPAVLDGLIHRIASSKNLPYQEAQRLVVRNACSFYNLS